MTSSRAIRWGILPNVRDLGDLPTTDGGRTVRGRVFRSPRLDELDAAGWQELAASGVRTVVDIRRVDEVRDLPQRLDHVTIIGAPVELDEADFEAEWLQVLNTPAYYRAALERWPALMVATFRAIAEAPTDGAVVVHCAAGRDRTGMIVAMLLQFAGVPDDVIVDDYAIGVREMNAWYAVNPHRWEPALEGDALDAWVGKTTGLLRQFLAAVDAEQYLRAHGFTDDEFAALRTRLLAA